MPGTPVNDLHRRVGILERRGAGSGLNADRLQGKSAADFALASHNHDGLYAPLVFPIYTLAARPAADSSWRGRCVLIETTGEPDEVHCCMRNSSGGYEWIVIGVGGT